MAGAAQQGAGRRAWGAPPAPKPAAEHRREMEAAATVSPPPQAALPHAHVGSARSKRALPHLSAVAGMSPRGRAEGEASQQQSRRGLMAMLPGAHRHKQQALAAHGAAAGQAAGTIGAAWEPAAPPEPPLLPSASPAGLTGLVPQGEEEDTVLIGSAAPSFSQPALLLPQPQAMGPPPPPPQQEQQAQHSRRPSSLPHDLATEDLSLTALAAASRRVTRYSSAPSMPSTSSSSGTSEAAQDAYREDHQQEQAQQPAPPEAGSERGMLPTGPSAYSPQLQQQQQQLRQLQQQQQQQQMARLNSAELTVLRQSLAELQLDSGDEGCSVGAAGCNDDIPDQLVLQALSSRLGRLDSQKRRVLLEVLAKIEGLGGAGCGSSAAGDGEAGRSSCSEAAGEHAGLASMAASQLIAELLHSSRRASPADGGGPRAAAEPVAGQAAPASPSADGTAADPAERSQLLSESGRLPEPEPQPSGEAAGAEAASAAPAAPDAGPHSPSKAMAGKLAVLRSRSSSFASRQQSGSGEAAAGSGASPSLPTAAQDVAALAAAVIGSARQASLSREQPQQMLPPQQQQQQPQPAAHLGHGSCKLHPMVQQRHRERSRLSVDGLRGPARQARPPRAEQQRSHLSPAVSVASSAAGDALSAFAAEHQVLPQPDGGAAASPAAASLHSSVDPLSAGMGDSLELLGQPSELYLATGPAASLSPHSARGQLPHTTTLPVLSPAGYSPTGKLQPGTAASAGCRASPEALAAAALAAASSRGSTAGGGASTSAAPSPAALLHCQELTLVLLDTWGDSHFVGLSGLQLLGPDGQPLPLGAEQLAADPPDLNCFPGHSGDVRTVDKLADGCNNTTDDAHMWLAPVKRQLSAAAAAAASASLRASHAGQGGSWAGLPEAAQAFNLLSVRLPAGGAWLSGLRVWNYNKSPADTSRGVKRMLVLADGVEVSPPGGVLVRRAPGTAAFPFGQHIPLHTCWAAAAGGGIDTGTGSAAARASGGSSPPRPPRRTTLQSGAGRTAAGQQAQQAQKQLSTHSESVAWVCNLPDPAAALEYLQRAALLAKAAGPGGGLVGQPGECFATALPCGFALRLVLLSSWGCPHYVGLSGLEVRDAVRGPLRIRPDQVFAVPNSVAALPAMAGDVRTPDKLVDGNTSGAAPHSWLAPLDGQQGNALHVMLDAPVLLSALRVWNYAKTPNRGVQQLEVYLDESLVWKGLLQRAPAELAPGQDFAQTLCFSEEAMAEAAATARRRAVAAAHSRSGRAAAATGGALPGATLGVEGVEEWCQAQERVVLVNEGEYVAFPPDTNVGPADARPVTSVVA
ncbi:hypothetical protein ABPG75_000701 [Micractinium tetrahymenae]